MSFEKALDKQFRSTCHRAMQRVGLNEALKTPFIIMEIAEL